MFCDSAYLFYFMCLTRLQLFIIIPSMIWYECLTTNKNNKEDQQMFLIEAKDEATAIDNCNKYFPEWDCFQATASSNQNPLD